MGNLNLNKLRTAPVLLTAVLASGLLLAGCDEHVDVVRDHSVVIPKHATWAWRPAPPPEKNPDKNPNPVISRDVITDDGRARTETREQGNIGRIDNETMRLAVKTDIEQDLARKGFQQVSDPAAAEFLVDYHVGIRRATETVARPVGYPGLVCGPFGCYESYRWGYWGGPGYAYENIHYREGTIVFDFAQQGSNKVAFRAVGQRPIYRGSLSTDHIRDAVNRVLRDLKPGK
jgi:uncharacterized protein DUF4136